MKNKKHKGKTKSKERLWIKPRIKLDNKSVTIFLISVVIPLIILVVVGLISMILQLKNLAQKAVNNQHPVYIVDSQPIDIDSYLREYFANKVPKKIMDVTVTAYSSTNGQTDGNPYRTAIGTLVREGIVAANFLPIGTVVRFPDKFGDKLFLVEDRMDERFGLQVDIWMSRQEEAKKFGIQYLKMEIF